MSLWTPGGEHPVDRPGPSAAPLPTPEAPPEPAELGPEEQARLEAMQAQMEQVQAQLLAAPAAVVVANHAMGLYELAALHLMQPEPRLAEASVAIDALGALVEGMTGRLGRDEETVREALAQLRAAYLDVRGRATSEPPDAAT